MGIYDSMAQWGQAYAPSPVAQTLFGPSGYDQIGSSMSSWGAPSLTSGAGSPTGVPALPSALPNVGSDPKLGFNMPTAQLGLAGIQSIGGLWAAFKQLALARDQFNFTKAFSTANLNNQTQSYNTALTDRANNRQIIEGNTPAQTQAYISANSLKKFGS